MRAAVHRSKFRLRRLGPALILGLVIASVGRFAPFGCRTPSATPGPAPTSGSLLDRLIAAYPELKSGRFLVIADFEDARNIDIVRLDPRSPHARVQLEPRGGNAQTGGGCLKFTVGSFEDALWFANTDSGSWYLKRDWRDFDILRFSVESPLDDLVLDVEIRSGRGERAKSTTLSTPLKRGWHDVQIDLADAADKLPLDDVSGVRFSVAGLDKPGTLRLDDLILTSIRESVVGDHENKSGDLYLRHVGRHWVVGAGGRFELAWRRGAFVGWYNTQADPFRIHNLLEGAMLGPWPASASGDGRQLEFVGSPQLDGEAAYEWTSQAPVRLLLTAELRLSNPAAAAPRSARNATVRYVIYPSGQVFSSVSVPTLAPVGSTARDALAVSTALLEKHPVELHPDSEVSLASGAPSPSFGWIRMSERQAALLFIPHHFPDGSQVLGERKIATHLAFLAVAQNQPNANSRRWCAQLLLADDHDWSDSVVAARAQAYQAPVPPVLERGRFAAVVDGETTAFDPATGAFVIEPDGNAARFVVDGRKAPYFSPAFEIVDRFQRPVWVYVNNAAHKLVARAASGDVIFQLPGVIRERLQIDVLLGP